MVFCQRVIKRVRRIIIKKLLLILAVVMGMRIAEARSIHILPLGDSITQGGVTNRPEYTYRYPLYGILKAAGYEFDFVGSLNAGLQSEAKWPTPFDLNHEGHYGWQTGAVRDKLPEWMAKWQAAPDIALIHLGTNDKSARDYLAAVGEPLKEIIILLRRQNPHVVVLIAHLNFKDSAALKIRLLVEQIAQETTTEQSPVVTVPMYEGWVANPKWADTDTFDWAHPNPQGQKKMAKKWFAAMKPYLDGLSGRPRTNWVPR